MKNLNKWSFSKLFMILSCAAAVFMTLPSETSAWSPYTHGAITVEAFSARRDLLPGAVYSSSIPDITTNFISPAAKDKLYSVFHGAGFMEAAESVLKTLDTKKETASIRAAYGFLSHAAADPVAHADSGYPNAKVTFKVKKELNHYTAYLFMDMICYKNYFDGYGGSFGKLVAAADANFIQKSLAANAKKTGEKINADKSFLAKKVATFTAGLAVEKAIFDCIIDGNPELFEQIRSFYCDYYLGVDGRGGFLDASGAVANQVANDRGVIKKDTGVAAFLNRQKYELIYAGMNIASEVAKDAEFIRTGSITSGRLRSLVDKFFANKSESSQAMGKLLSAILFRKDLTYEEIIASIDGATVARIDDKFERYRAAYKNVKQGRWYSFVPGTGRNEKVEYADSFAAYESAKAENALDAAGVGTTEKARVMELVKARAEKFKDHYLASGLNIIGKARRAGASDAAFACASFALNYAVDRAKAQKAGDSSLVAKLDAQAKYFSDSANARIKSAASMKLIDKILGPRSAAYNSSYSSSAAPLLASIAAIAPKSSKTPAPPAGAGTAKTPEQIAETADRSEILLEAAKMGLTKPSCAKDAYDLMKKSYAGYVKAASSDASAEISGEAAKMLKTYLFYKNCYEELVKKEVKAE